jgi:transposase
MYSLDFRRRVLAIKASEGLSFREISCRFKVGIATVVRWSNRIEPMLTRNKSPTKIDSDALKKDVEQYPDAYQYERAKRFGVSQKGISVALKRLGVTYKKNPQSPKSGPRKKMYVLSKDQCL